MKMATLLAAVSIATLLALPLPAAAGPRGGGHGGHGGHGGWQGHGSHGGWHGHGSRVFIGGSFGWDPFFWPSYPYYPYYPYYGAYPVYGYPYPPPPPPGPVEQAPPDATPPDDTAAADDDETDANPQAESASYGLVQLRGVPDGAAVDLDGRFWLTASHLDDRWLALPRGTHKLTVRVRGADPIEQQIDVTSGRTQVVRFAPRG